MLRNYILIDELKNLPCQFAHEVDRIYENKNHKLFRPLCEELEVVNTESDLYKRLIRKFSWHVERGSKIDPALTSRKWILSSEISKSISQLRLSTLCGECQLDRPQPYGSKALLGLEINENGLVRLSHFDIFLGCFTIGDCTFTLLPSLCSFHSNYWISNFISNHPKRLDFFIRLDPFVLGRTNELRITQYLMVVYGRTFFFKRIKKLRNIESGKWMSDDVLTNNQKFTEYV